LLVSQEQEKNEVELKDRKSLNVRIPRALGKRLKLHCLQREITVAKFVIEAIEEKLSREEVVSPAPATEHKEVNETLGADSILQS